jgi:MFS family permease
VEVTLGLATATFAAVLFVMAFVRSKVALVPLMLLGGAAWTVFMSGFNILVQKLAPDWVRSRVLAFYLFVFQGSVALGSTVWGFVATHAGVHRALAFASAGTAGCLVLQPLLRLPSTKADLTSWNHWLRPTMFEEPDPEDGPVLVTVKYVIDPAKLHDFLRDIHRYARVRRRDGATEWGIFADTENPNVYLESFLVDSWAEHKRQHYRFTRADADIEKHVQSYAVKPPEVKHYIYAPKRQGSQHRERERPES